MNEGISVLFGDQYHVVPSGRMCAYAVTKWMRGDDLSRGQQAVLDLMLAGF